MTKIKRFIPLIIIYVILLTVLVVTAVYPAADYDVSQKLTGLSFSYPVGNFLEIWIEPVTLVPMCFVIAMLSVCLVRTKWKNALPQIMGGGLMLGGAILSYEVIHRIVKYYCKLEDITKPWTYVEKPLSSDLLWVKVICAAGGVVMMALFVFISSRIAQDRLVKAQRVLFVSVFVLLAELAIVSGLKYVWGRVRYRYWIGLGEEERLYFPWYLLRGKPDNDNFKSFPSGHTANSTLILPMTFIFDALGKKNAGRILRICHIGWMIVVMTSRIMAGAHYLSDVAGGALVSLSIISVTAAVVFRDGKISKEEK